MAADPAGGAGNGSTGRGVKERITNDGLSLGIVGAGFMSQGTAEAGAGAPAAAASSQAGRWVAGRDPVSGTVADRQLLDNPPRVASERRIDTPLRQSRTPLTGVGVPVEADALTCAPSAPRVGRGDELALYLQNVPASAVAVIGARPLGAIAARLTPMNHERNDRGLCAAERSTGLEG
jgi:hypothetical protein